VDPCQVHTELEAFIDMHAAQWRARGKLGHFGDWPRAWAFHHDLVAALSAQDRVRLLRLSAGGKVIARQYAFVFADTCSCRLSARDAGQQWDAYGPGMASLLTLFEDAIDEGMRTIDAGTGDYGYKRRLGGAEHDARSILLVANRGGARRRARVMCLWTDWLDRLDSIPVAVRPVPDVGVQRGPPDQAGGRRPGRPRGRRLLGRRARGPDGRTQPQRPRVQRPAQCDHG
jgi:hypothetical protein